MTTEFFSSFQYMPSLPVDELAELVTQTQAGDQAAKEVLCKQFRPLVEATAHNAFFRNTLGEDALGISWVIFLETVQNYHKPDFTFFPGLLQRALTCRLINAVRDKGNIDEHLVYDDYESVKYTASAPDQSQLEDHILKESLARLRPEERKLLYEHYVLDRSFATLAATYNLTENALYARHHRIIAKLRKLYLDVHHCIPQME